MVGFGRVPLPVIFFSFLFFLPLSFFLNLCHLNTHLKNLWWIDLVLHLQCNWHPESNTYYYNIFTHNFFFCPTISKRSKAKWFTPRERGKTSQIIIIKKEIQKFVPCFNPPQNGKRTDTQYKNITIFIYQIASVGSCSGTRFSAERISIFNLLVCLFFFWSFFSLQLASPIVQRFLHHCKHDLSCAVQRSWHTFCFFFFALLLGCIFFFHITKLQLYSHIFKFKFLFLNTRKKQKYFVWSATPLFLLTLRLQNCFFFLNFPSALLLWEVQRETVREEWTSVQKTFPALFTSTFFLIYYPFIYIFFLKNNHKSIKKHEMK